MSESIVDQSTEILQNEYTFPNFLPSSDCRELLQILKRQVKPHKIIFWVTFLAFLFFLVLATIFLINATSVEFQIGTWDETLKQYVHDKPDYTGTIICAVLCGISIIVGIVNLALAAKYSNKISSLTASIQINSQYSAFINQGYDKKEAYKLTLERLDRQSNMATLNSIASTNALIAMSYISHTNK